MVRALIATVGGTPQPLIESITKHQPEYICFICSQESVERIAEIKAALRERGIPPFKDHKVLLKDINDLTQCYQDTLAVLDQLRAWDVPLNEVWVDYTGGTKSMSVAVGLIALTEGISFSYVGGAQREKEGMGVVIDGSEEIYSGISPWRLFAIRGKRRIVDAFNHYRFEAARSLIAEIEGSQASEAIKAELKAVSVLCEAYELWERFDLRNALGKLHQASAQLTSFVQASSSKEYGEVLKQVQRNINWLKDISAASDSFKFSSDKMVIDLIANAERRATEGKYDDAVARLYRALEMAGQAALREIGINDAGKVSPALIPESLREEYCKKYETEGVLKLGSLAVFQLLKEKAHPRGIAYYQSESAMKGILSARNSSILAHGLQPIKKETYEALKTKLLDFLGNPLLPGFPKLTLNS